jgi:hypothetical protein
MDFTSRGRILHGVLVIIPRTRTSSSSSVMAPSFIDIQNRYSPYAIKKPATYTYKAHVRMIPPPPPYVSAVNCHHQGVRSKSYAV